MNLPTVTPRQMKYYHRSSNPANLIHGLAEELEELTTKLLNEVQPGMVDPVNHEAEDVWDALKNVSDRLESAHIITWETLNEIYRANPPEGD